MQRCNLADVNMRELKQLGLWRPVKRTAGLLKSLQARTSLTDRLTAEYPTARLNQPKRVQNTEIKGYVDLYWIDDNGQRLFYTEPPPGYEDFVYQVAPATADYVVQYAGPDGPVTYYGISSGEYMGEYLKGEYYR